MKRRSPAPLAARALAAAMLISAAIVNRYRVFAVRRDPPGAPINAPEARTS